jgi:hypothetical protein
MTETAQAGSASSATEAVNDVTPSHHIASGQSTRSEDPKRQYRNLRVSVYDHNQIESIRTTTGLRTKSAVVDYLLEIEKTRKPTPPTATPELVFGDDRPVLLNAPSGDFKSSQLKLLLRNANAPTFLVDPAAEYSTFKKVGLENLPSLPWKTAGPETRLRFTPSTEGEEIAHVQLEILYRTLNMLRHQDFNPRRIPSGKLSRWVFCQDEAHQVSNLHVFQTFLAENRKFTRKLILAASDPTLFESTCRVLRPKVHREFVKKASRPGARLEGEAFIDALVVHDRECAGC